MSRTFWVDASDPLCFQIPKETRLARDRRCGRVAYQEIRKKVASSHGENAGTVPAFSSGGEGKGKGGPGDWQEPRKWYGFESDEQAADYPQTPLKTLLLFRNPGDSPRDRMDQSRQREVLAHRSARHRRLSLGSYLLTDGSRSAGSFCRNGSSGSDA